MVLLFLTALVMQLGTLTLLEDDRSTSLFGDEPGYWELAEGRWLSILRPPGYPAAVAAARACFGDSPLAVFVAQSVAVSASAVLVFLLLLEGGVSSRVASLCGLLSVLSFTSLGVSKRVLADGLLAVITLAAVYFFVTGRRSNSRRTWVAGVLAAIGLLVKPVMIVWLAFVPLAAAAAGERGGRWARRSLAATAPLAATWLIVWILNATFLGHGAYSEIGRLAVVRYWVPATITLSETGGVWNAARIDELRNLWTPHDLLAGNPTPQEFERVWGEGLQVLRSRPTWAIAAAVASSWRNLPRPFFPSELGVLVNPHHISPVAWILGKVLTYALWVFSAVGGVLLLRSARGRVVGTPALLLATLFVLATAISHSEGARLLFPIEWSLFTGLGGLASLGGRRKTGADAAVTEASS